MPDIQSIELSRSPGNKIEVIKHPGSYKLLGAGQQGAVFKISPDRCVKVYTECKEAGRERKVMDKLRGSPYFPRLYETGPNFIVMEYLKGPSLDKYLAGKREIPGFLAYELVNLLNEMERAGFSRIDTHLRHIFLDNEVKKVKLIDHVNVMGKKQPDPVKLLKGLKKLGLRQSFLQQVKKIDPGKYNSWKNLKV